jgi:hypothetical protein
LGLLNSQIQPMPLTQLWASTQGFYYITTAYENYKYINFQEQKMKKVSKKWFWKTKNESLKKFFFFVSRKLLTILMGGGSEWSSLEQSLQSQKQVLRGWGGKNAFSFIINAREIHFSMTKIYNRGVSLFVLICQIQTSKFNQSQYNFTFF